MSKIWLLWFFNKTLSYLIMFRPFLPVTEPDIMHPSKYLKIVIMSFWIHRSYDEFISHLCNRILSHLMMFNLFLTVNEPDIKHLSRYLKICFLKLSVRRSYKKFQPLTTFAEKLNHIYLGNSYISLYPGKKTLKKSLDIAY